MTLSQIKTQEEKKLYWKSQYQKLRHTPNYVERRKNRDKTYRRKHPFQQFSKSIRKDDKVIVTKEELAKLLYRQRCICPLTGRKINRDNISLDHITPKSKGGCRGIKNLRFVVKGANLAKHTMTDNELLELARDIVKTLA